ncbi:MAG TPA: hypothetical protein ENI27_07180, partial [bacterium]|nr:hypothetical protein [bacterium]
MCDFKRRDFLKMGAISSGIFVGSGIEKSHAADKEERLSDKMRHKKIVNLNPSQNKILVNGLSELVRITEGLNFKTLPSEKYPFPLTYIAYSEMPDPETVRKDVKSGMSSDPIGVLENALALLELYECNQPEIKNIIPDDMRFVRDSFSTKRMNGWIAVLGNTDLKNLESAVNERWQFRFFNKGPSQTNVYTMLNMLVRYAHVYGRTHYSDEDDFLHFIDESCSVEMLDPHTMGHFIDELCPGLLVCHGEMTDLDLTLSLMAMKIGVPAIVPSDYPFPLGKTIRAKRTEDIVESVVLFPNIRRLLDFPDIPSLPAYCDPENMRKVVKTHVVWGDTPESFYILRKGKVDSPGFVVTGKPTGPLGVVITCLLYTS